jgi:hypothetical protein
VATAACAFAWYSPVTHSAQNVSQFTANVRDHGLDLLPNSKPGENPVTSYLSGNKPERLDAARYAQLVHDQYARTRPYVKPLSSAGSPRYALQNASAGADAVKNERALNGLKLLELGVSQIANVLAVLGALALVLRRKPGGWARELGILGLATLSFVAFVRVSGTAANAYNQERAFVQTMVPLGIALGWVLQTTGSRLRRFGPSIVGLVAAFGLVAIFVSTSGLRGVALGGGTPANLANKGEDYERFYVTPPELASAKWMTNAPNGSLVYTDRYGQLRVLAATGRTNGLLLDVTPETLGNHAWVYGSRTNVVDGRARGEVGQRYALYRWPARFLDEQFNLVYTNGSTAVWHR